MAKVAICAGHGGSDSGAIKYLVEKDVNLVEAIACRDFLCKNGIIVHMSRTSDEYVDLMEKIKKVNELNVDLALDIHNNASGSGNADGFEAYYHFKGGLGKTLAENIEHEVKAIGQNSRGCKIKLDESGLDYYAFIRSTNCPAVIVEGCFVDSKEDITIADTQEKQKAFGIAYAKGILKTLDIKFEDEKVEENSTDKKHYIQIGCFSSEENAIKQLEKAKELGFKDAFIKTL